MVGALVKGTSLDGDFFKIDAGSTVPRLADDWNDAANSVVTQEVTRISMSVSIDDAEMFINSSTKTTLRLMFSSCANHTRARIRKWLLPPPDFEITQEYKAMYKITRFLFN